MSPSILYNICCLGLIGISKLEQKLHGHGIFLSHSNFKEISKHKVTVSFFLSSIKSLLFEEMNID